MQFFCPGARIHAISSLMLFVNGKSRGQSGHAAALEILYKVDIITQIN